VRFWQETTDWSYSQEFVDVVVWGSWMEAPLVEAAAAEPAQERKDDTGRWIILELNGNIRYQAHAAAISNASMADEKGWVIVL
jgi:hypothetical protein